MYFEEKAFHIKLFPSFNQPYTSANNNNNPGVLYQLETDIILSYEEDATFRKEELPLQIFKKCRNTEY